MKRVIRASSENGQQVSIFTFENMTAAEIDTYLESLPVGSRITDVCTKPDRHKIDCIIEKKSAYVPNMHNRFGGPNEHKFHEIFWTIGGYKDPYFGSKKILEILDSTSKYYQISPRAVTSGTVVAKGHLEGEYPFSQYTGEPYVSPDLWNSCRGVKTSKDVYAEFEAIVDKYFPDVDKIENEIFKLYHQNRQSKAYQEAWRLWKEDQADDNE